MVLSIAPYRDVAVRLDLVDPETLFHHTSCPVQQLLQLQQGKGSYLRNKEPWAKQSLDARNKNFLKLQTVRLN